MLVFVTDGQQTVYGPHFEQHLFRRVVFVSWWKSLCALFLDRYASSIDDILEDEEHYADQLKEYLFYAEALR